MARKSLAIANWFLDRAERERRRLTPLELLKFVYISDGWHRALLGEPLIEEPIEAWKYGPVIPSIYRAFSRYGGNPIQGRATLTETEGGMPETPTFTGDERQENVLEAVWNNYKHLSGGQFINLTHQPGSPWAETWSEQSPHGKPSIIDGEKIKQHYREKAKQMFARKAQAISGRPEHPPAPNSAQMKSRKKP